MFPADDLIHIVEVGKPLLRRKRSLDCIYFIAVLGEQISVKERTKEDLSQQNDKQEYRTRYEQDASKNSSSFTERFLFALLPAHVHLFPVQIRARA